MNERSPQMPIWSPGWSTVSMLTVRRGRAVELGVNSDAPQPYCVQYGGSGHYFRTEADVLAYCCGRGWVEGVVHERVRPGADWEELEAILWRKGRPVRIYRVPGPDRPVCVYCRGQGYYFKTITEARAFCYGRGWLRNSALIYREDLA